MIRPRPLCIAFVLTVLTTVTAGAQSPIPTLETSALAGEKAIAKHLVEDSVGDVQLGQLGMQMAHAAPVRAFARAMVADHTRTAEAAMPVAERLGAAAKMEPDTSNQVDISHLARYRGAQFDREYLKTLVEAHETDISAIDAAMEFTTDAGLRTLLRTVRAVDVRHLALATSAQRSIGEHE
jgi:putative membrane protein